ncbi:MAG: polyprenyl synthetase family protein [candidate division NC10 bacterium]|nr:polyprenyl synthetase family protein [candidate division NC10 bacterium]
METAEYVEARRLLVEEALRRFLPPQTKEPAVIHRAMHYSVFGGGKRLRPVLVLAAAEAVGGKVEPLLPVAAALEFIHTYSLIHDDLPAMDDDDFRRGRPTSHRVFGEAVAILAGDALLTEAFRLLTAPDCVNRHDPKRLLTVIQEIAAAAGSRGMVGGQALDIVSEGQAVDAAHIESVHRRKTGALIRASLRAGALLAGASPGQLEAITAYGEAVGLAFQIADDILNVEGEAATTGKAVGSDAAKGKATYPAVHGLAEAKARAAALVAEALRALTPLDARADPLRGIARFIVERRR